MGCFKLHSANITALLQDNLSLAHLAEIFEILKKISHESKYDLLITNKVVK